MSLNVILSLIERRGWCVRARGIGRRVDGLSCAVVRTGAALHDVCTTRPRTKLWRRLSHWRATDVTWSCYIIIEYIWFKSYYYLKSYCCCSDYPPFNFWWVLLFTKCFLFFCSKKKKKIKNLLLFHCRNRIGSANARLSHVRERPQRHRKHCQQRQQTASSTHQTQTTAPHHGRRRVAARLSRQQHCVVCSRRYNSCFTHVFLFVFVFWFSFVFRFWLLGLRGYAATIMSLYEPIQPLNILLTLYLPDDLPTIDSFDVCKFKKQFFFKKKLQLF